MITYRKGNLVDAFINKEINILVHQANCFRTFGTGIAKEIKERLPQAYNADLATGWGDENKLGSYSCAKIFPGRIVINLYGQYNYGRDKRYTNYGALAKGLSMISQHYASEDVFLPQKFGFPKIGCGSAGGDWSVVSEMIEFYFKNEEVYVYELE